MGVSRCIAQAIGIAQAPRDTWKDAIAALPEVCPCPNVCTDGVGCRVVVGDYLRMQWRIQMRLEEKKGRTR